VFVMPHQFLDKCLDTIEGHIAPGAKAISLIKVSAGAGGCRGATGAWAGR
jgi:hypothetical protein